MSDVVFKCPVCRKILCADDASVGVSFNCPSCGENVTLPQPEYIFHCAFCECKLLTIESMIGEKVECTSCGRELFVPGDSEKISQPTEVNVINITCQSCSTELEVEGSHLGGGMIDCPKCGAKIFIPSSTVDDASVSSVSQLSPSKCPACNADMPGNAVICIGCGFDLRTGTKLSLGPESQKRKLAFKKATEMPAESPPNSILDRYPMPQFKPPTLFERILPVLKSVMCMVVIAAVVLAVLHFVDVRAVWGKVAVIFGKKPSQEVVVDKSILGPQASGKSGTKPGEKNETKNADEIMRVLEVLNAKPGDQTALQDLMSCIRVVPDLNDNNLIKGGMKTVFSLAQFAYGDEQIGLGGREHILKNYPGTEFTGMLDKTRFYVACPQCSQKGEIRNSCSTCSGVKTCRICGGDGMVVTTQVVKQQGLATRSANNNSSGLAHYHNYWYGHYHSGRSSAPTRRLGDPIVQPEKQTVNVPCTKCSGTGQCRTCRGTGYLGAQCPNCMSMGSLLSTNKAAEQYKTALTRTLSLLQQRHLQGKDVEFLRNDQLDGEGEGTGQVSSNDVASSVIQPK